MKIGDKKQFTIYPKYISIDKFSNKLNSVADAGKCDFANLKKNELESSVKEVGTDINKALKKIREWLIKNYPDNDWKLKISKNGNYNFWKVQSTLQSRQDNYRPPKKNKIPRWKMEQIEDQAKWDVPAYKQAEMDAWEYDGPARKFEDWREGNGY